MPDTDLETASLIGERLRYGVASSQFAVPAGANIDVTLSVGLTALQPGDTRNRS